MEVAESTLSKMKTNGIFCSQKIYISNIIVKAIVVGEVPAAGKR